MRPSSGGGVVDREILDQFRVSSSEGVGVGNVFRKEVGSEVNAIQFSGDGKMISAALGDGSLYVCRASGSGSSSTDLAAGPLTAVAWTGEAKLVAGDSEGRLHWVGIKEGGAFENGGSIFLEGEKALSLDFSPELGKIAVGGQSGRVALIDAETKAEAAGLGERMPPGEASRIFSLRFFDSAAVSSSSPLLAWGGWGGAVQLWDVRAGRKIARIPGPSLSGDCLDVSDNLLLAGSYRDRENLEIFDLRTLSRLESLDFTGPRGQAVNYTSACRFGRGAKGERIVLAGSCIGGQVAIFKQYEKFRPELYLEGVPKGVFSAGFGGEPGLFAVGSGDGNLSVARVTF